MSAALAMPDDLHADDRANAPVRHDGVLDLDQDVALQELLRTIAQQLKLDPGRGFAFDLSSPFGWRLGITGTSILLAGRREDTGGS